MSLVTIIIPTYNSSATIASAIESVLLQSFENWELIIVDGASHDDTVSKAKKCADVDQRIKVISEPDKGVFDAMNKGLQAAKGEWVYFLGSDDQLYDAHTLDIVFNKYDTARHDVFYGNVANEFLGRIYDGEFTGDDLFQKNICHQSIFIKRHVFSKIGQFNLKYKIYADWEHNMRWFYDKNISHIFINETIARFAANGLSSQCGDGIFLKERTMIYLFCAYKTLSLKVRIRLLKQEYSRLLHGKNRKLLLKLVLRTPQILAG